jgi:hypothetical protein
VAAFARPRTASSNGIFDKRDSYRRTIHTLSGTSVLYSTSPSYNRSTLASASLMDQNRSESHRGSRLGPGGPYQDLSSHEITWRDRQQFLESRGYMLRPRLRPGWTPSWLRTGTYWRRAEDSAQLPVCMNGLTTSIFSFCWAQARTRLVDATRIADGKLVYIKQVQTNDRESRIASVLSSYEGPTNHSVPILDTFVDSSDESISYMVMSFLRTLDEPPFHAVGEIVDFAGQILEVSTVLWLSVQ